MHSHKFVICTTDIVTTLYLVLGLLVHDTILVFFTFNLCVLACLSLMQLGGCGLFGVGVWLSFKQAEISSLPLSFPSLSAANLLLVAGGITMVTGFLGCLGALKEQRCLLMTVRHLGIAG